MLPTAVLPAGRHDRPQKKQSFGFRLYQRSSSRIAADTLPCCVYSGYTRRERPNARTHALSMAVDAQQAALSPSDGSEHRRGGVVGMAAPSPSHAGLRRLAASAAAPGLRAVSPTRAARGLAGLSTQPIHHHPTARQYAHMHLSPKSTFACSSALPEARPSGEAGGWGYLQCVRARVCGGCHRLAQLIVAQPYRARTGLRSC